MRALFALLAIVGVSACAHPEAFQVASVYQINGWQASCRGGTGGLTCDMAKQVTGVGNFRVVWTARSATLSELTCRSADGWKNTVFDRRGEADEAAIAIHNRIQEVVTSCNRDAVAEISDTLEVAMLLARATD